MAAAAMVLPEQELVAVCRGTVATTAASYGPWHNPHVVSNEEESPMYEAFCAHTKRVFGKKTVTLPDSEEVLFVRKSSMRPGASWAELKLGDRVDITFKECAGRSVVTDAVKAS